MFKEKVVKYRNTDTNPKDAMEITTSEMPYLQQVGQEEPMEDRGAFLYFLPFAPPDIFPKKCYLENTSVTRSRLRFL